MGVCLPGGDDDSVQLGSMLNGGEANCDGNYPYGTEKKGPYLEDTTMVGSYRPNAFELYDMHGNMGERARIGTMRVTTRFPL